MRRNVRNIGRDRALREGQLKFGVAKKEERADSPPCNMRSEHNELFLARRCAVPLVAAGLFFSSCPLVFAEDDTISALREKIDRAEKERVEICKILGAIYEEMGETDKVIECYRTGFQVFPDDPFLCSKLRDLYAAKERWADLASIYKRLVNANPGGNETYMKTLAECHLKAGQHQEALAVLTELLDEYGDASADYRDAAQMLMAHEQYDAAATLCQKGIQGDFGKSPELHCILGLAQLKAGKYGEAIVAYRKAIELGVSGRDRLDLEQQLAKVCKEEPVIEYVLREKLESVKAIDQRLAELYWLKALKEEGAGRLDAAIALCRKIVLLVPDSEIGKAAQKKIQELGNP